jgi:hypothetical protein
MDESMRVRILGDAKGAKDAFEQVGAAADATAKHIEGTFHHAGSILKKAIGITAVSVGLEQALEGASKLINLQKVQSKLLDNAGAAKKYELQGTQESVRWYSKILDQQATQLSLQNGIAKSQVVQAQTLLLQNADLRKLYDTNKGAMVQALDAAANLSEVMGGGGGGSIVSSARRLNIMLADPAKKMNMMARQGVTLSKAEQAYVKSQQASAQGAAGIQRGQIALLKVLKKEYGDVARAAASPVELLKNLYQNVMLSLGTGLIPILESLAESLIPPVTALLPVLEFMAETIGEVSETLGKALGSILTALVPLFTLMTNSIIPALLNIITPLIQMVDAALTPIVKVFADMVGTSEHLGPLAKVISDIGVQTAKNLQPAIIAIAKAFEDMAASGVIKDLFQAILDSIVALAPIMPALATAFAQIVTALVPIIVDSGPEFTKMITLWTELLKVITPLITGAAQVIADMFGKLGGFSKPIAILLAVWFTKKLFLTPIFAAIQAVGRLLGKINDVGMAMQNVGSSTKTLLTSGVSASLANRSDYKTRLAGNAKMKYDQFESAYGSGDSRTIRAKAEMERLHAQALRGSSRSEMVAMQGGGARGLSRYMMGLPFKGTGGPRIPDMPLMPYELEKLSKKYTKLNPQDKMKNIMAAYSKRKAWETQFGAGDWDVKPSEAVKATWDHEKSLKASGAASRARRSKLMRVGGRVAGVGGAAFTAAAMTGLVPSPGKGVGGAIGSVAQFASMGMAFGPWGAAIGAAIGGIKALWDNCKPFHDFVVKIGKSIMTWGKQLWKQVLPYLKEFGAQIKELWAKAQPGIKMFGEFMKKYITTEIKLIVLAVKGLIMWWKFLWNVGKIVAQSFADAFTTVFNAIKHGVNAVIHLINGMIRIYNLIPGHTDIKTIGTLGTSTAIKLHSGGIVPGPRGREVPAILQAGEAVVSLGQMNRAGMGGNAGASLNVHPGAVNITVNGNADAQTVALIKQHVNAQFDELHRTLKSMGR